MLYVHRISRQLSEATSMQITLIIVVSLHVLAGVFWAGSTFAIARASDASLAVRLFRPQMGAAAGAIVTGALLWHFLHGAAFGVTERMLVVGVVAALAAGGVQGVSGSRMRRQLARGASPSAPSADPGSQAGAPPLSMAGPRLAAALLAVTVVCMAAARFA
jgi:hypothetical protein